jgi:hypothetical protein
MNFLKSLQQSPIGDWVRSSDYGFYICLAGHAIGMGVVVGAVFMLCIRVLGFSQEQPLLQFEPLFKIAQVGFLLNAATGIALFMANGVNLASNFPFLLKLSFIAVGGVLVWLLWRRLMEERAVVIDGGGAASNQTKMLAAATLACWLIAIMAGRIIGYTIVY